MAAEASEYLENLRYCVRWLAEERSGPRAADEFLKEAGDNESALFTAYRDLANVREPLPATKQFLAIQDAMLQETTIRKGITDAHAIMPIPRDQRIALWRGDITALRVDAIVNAANAQMLGCWIPGHHCIDNAIHSFAGVQLRIECARLMQEQGHEDPTGKAKVTPAYNLPAGCIIHTVGPICQGEPSGRDRAYLSSCYARCLDAAATEGCKDIAFCCISTGAFGFPQREAALIATDTVVRWLDAHPKTPLRVIFNVFTQEDQEIYFSRLYEQLNVR